MKTRSWLGLLPILLLVISCSTTPATTAESSTEAMPPLAVEENTSIEGVVVPAQQSTMSFLVAGNVAEVSVAKGDLVQAGDSLITLATPELDSAVLASEASLRAAEADLVYWMVTRKHKPPERRWLAEDRVDAAKAAVETALASQKQKTLLASYQATVVEINASKGEVISAYQDVILLADLSNLKIETTDLNERDVVNLSVGQRAFVFVEALDAEFEGKVTAISPLPNDESIDVVYTATIELDEIPAPLRWGMSVTINFEKK